MLKLLEKILGLGVIPPEWKQRVYSLLLSVVVLVETFVDIPDEWHTEKVLTQLALVICIILAYILKKVRDVTGRTVQ